jgi:hypothetical protein
LDLVYTTHCFTEVIKEMRSVGEPNSMMIWRVRKRALN